MVNVVTLVKKVRSVTVVKRLTLVILVKNVRVQVVILVAGGTGIKGKSTSGIIGKGGKSGNIGKST